MTRNIVTSYQTDLATGETKALNGYTWVATPRAKNGFTNGFHAMANTASKHIAQQLTKVETFRVMHALMGDVQMENHVIVNQAQTARELGMKQPSVARAIKDLVDKKILLVGPKLGRLVSYKFNPQILWRGSARNHTKTLTEQRREAAGFNVIDGGIPFERQDKKTFDWITPPTK
jgi:DNA-binding MarR family transcriptional regulator